MTTPRSRKTPWSTSESGASREASLAGGVNDDWLCMESCLGTWICDSFTVGDPSTIVLLVVLVGKTSGACGKRVG